MSITLIKRRAQAAAAALGAVSHPRLVGGFDKVDGCRRY